MDICAAIAKQAKRRGIPCAELARRTGMNSEVLRRSLNGSRPLRADELVNLCAELEMSMSDLTGRN